MKNRIFTRHRARHYGKPDAFHTYERAHPVQLRDAAGNILCLFPTLGGGYVTEQTRAQSVRLARRIVRLLNP